jgi:hypothetical protein
VHAFGHLGGEGAGFDEGVRGGLALEGFAGGEAPVDLSALVGSGGLGEAEDLSGVLRGGGDLPGLLEAELLFGAFVGGVFGVEVGVAAQALILALDAFVFDARFVEGLGDGLGEAACGGGDGVGVAVEDFKADVDGGDVGGGCGFVGGVDGEGFVLGIDLDGLGCGCSRDEQ